MISNLIIRQFGLCEYEKSYRLMTGFTDQRHVDTPDELWCLEHPHVFTLGLAGKKEHVLDAGDIPVIKTDRGGQVTYHGPGQLVVYLLLDLRRKGITVKKYVYLLEQVVIDMCRHLSISAERKPDAPGVYVHGKKIAALGIRVKRGCSYHGLALNVDMDLASFNQINPCGYPGLQVTQLSDLGCSMDVNEAFDCLLPYLFKHFGYDTYEIPETEDRLKEPLIKFQHNLSGHSGGSRNPVKTHSPLDAGLHRHDEIRT
ncbi:MAG: lipoyl(octanoyl) transferase LipB [Gammaproteobacteria bacterium]|nr:lipoyl(octanoyl) transferase LipB [Gammaproteobacteria bacterium]